MIYNLLVCLDSSLPAGRQGYAQNLFWRLLPLPFSTPSGDCVTIREMPCLSSWTLRPCHPDPEWSEGEGSRFLAQGKLREGSHEFLRFDQDMLPCLPAGRGYRLRMTLRHSLLGAWSIGFNKNFLPIDGCSVFHSISRSLRFFYPLIILTHWEDWEFMFFYFHGQDLPFQEIFLVDWYSNCNFCITLAKKVFWK